MSLYVSSPSCDAETRAWNLWPLPAPLLAASGHMQLPFSLCFFCDNKQVQFLSSLFDDHVLIFNETGIDMAAEGKQDHKHSESVGCEFYILSLSARKGGGVSVFHRQFLSWRVSATGG